MERIGIGIIGTGFMGKAHALAYGAAASTFPGLPRPDLVAVADVVPQAAQAAAAQFGFRRWHTDWRAVVDDPDVAVVSITTPNLLHHEMAVAAARAGKHIHCEKPLAQDAGVARAMVDAADAAGVKTQVGFNYLKNPVLKLAQEMIATGELGEITGFRGIHAEDFMVSPQVPWSWRLDPAGGAGALADLGSHIIALARFLLGPIASLTADLHTVVGERPVAAGATQTRKVEVDDIARLTVRFARGCGGTLEANWMATGRKMQLAFEVSGTKGGLAFTQERFNELHWYRAGDDPRLAGFTRIEAGPQHAPYRNFCIAPGHQIGFNDLKTIEVAGFLAAIAGGPPSGPDFREAWEIQKVIDTTIAASRARGWLDVP
jgi:predicted dehydrogenase